MQLFKETPKNTHWRIDFSPNKVYIGNPEIELDELLSSDFLGYYNCIIDFNKEHLVTNFKTLPSFKVTDDTILQYKIEIQLLIMSHRRDFAPYEYIKKPLG